MYLINISIIYHYFRADEEIIERNHIVEATSEDEAVLKLTEYYSYEVKSFNAEKDEIDINYITEIIK